MVQFLYLNVNNALRLLVARVSSVNKGGPLSIVFLLIIDYEFKSSAAGVFRSKFMLFLELLLLINSY